MAETVSLTVQLVDKVSGGARKAANALGKIVSFLRRITTGSKSATENTKKLASQTEGAASGIKKLAAQYLTFQAAKGVFMAVGRGIAAAARGFFQAAVTAESLSRGIGTFLKDAKKGEKAFLSLIKISNKTGLSIEAAATTFRGFISAGLDVPAAKEMVRFQADLQSLATTPQELERVTNAFIQMEKAIVTGRFEADGFNSVLAGIPGADKLKVITRISKLTGKSIKELSKDITKLPVNATIQAFKELFKEGVHGSDAMRKKLGDLAEAKQFETLGGATKGFANQIKNAVMVAGAKLAPVMKSVLLPAFKAFQKALGGIDSDKVIKRLADGLRAAAPGILAFFKGFGRGIGTAVDVISKLIKGIGKLVGSAGKTDTLERFGEAIANIGTALLLAVGGMGVVLGGIVSIAMKIAGAISSVIEWFKKLASSPLEALQGLVTAANNVGKMIVMGFVNGIKAAAGFLYSAISSLIKSAIAQAAGGLKISSPSKVFEYMGKMTAVGFAEGVEGVDAMPSLQGSARLGVPMGGAPVINQSNVFETSVNEAASAAATASEIKKQQLLQMASAFERAALELGVAVQ
jgi:phage-related protein